MTQHSAGQSPPAKCRNGKAGNSLVEYTVIGSSALLLALMGIQAFAGDFASLLGLVKNDMKKQIAATAQAQVIQQANAANADKDAQPQAPQNTQPNLDSSLSAVEPYSAVQVSGANGIDIVDYYADIIKTIADKAHSASNSDITFALMLDDLAAEGHHVADDERATLTVFAKYSSSFDFSIQDRYAQTLKRAIDYLNAKPGLLSAEDSQTLRTASNNITQQMVDFLGGANPSNISAEAINQKFTDAGGGNGATYVDKEASTICGTGGQNCT